MPSFKATVEVQELGVPLQDVSQCHISVGAYAKYGTATHGTLTGRSLKALKVAEAD